jgi:hypothetical protein
VIRAGAGADDQNISQLLAAVSSYPEGAL